jgi:predicted nucleic acid-binding protein
MMRLLDTNILSELVRQRPNPQVIDQLFSQSYGTLFASEYTRYELRRGACLRLDNGRLWSRLEAMVIPIAEWLPITRAISLQAAELAVDLQRKGQQIGSADTFLAASALTHQLILVTRNTRHFCRVPGLTIENWFGDH